MSVSHVMPQRRDSPSPAGLERLSIAALARLFPFVHRVEGIAQRDFLNVARIDIRSEEHTSELQSLMRISYAVFCLKKKNKNKKTTTRNNITHKQDQHYRMKRI